MKKLRTAASAAVAEAASIARSFERVHEGDGGLDDADREHKLNRIRSLVARASCFNSAANAWCIRLDAFRAEAYNALTHELGGTWLRNESLRQQRLQRAVGVAHALLNSASAPQAQLEVTRVEFDPFVQQLVRAADSSSNSQNNADNLHVCLHHKASTLPRKKKPNILPSYYNERAVGT